MGQHQQAPLFIYVLDEKLRLRLPVEGLPGGKLCRQLCILPRPPWFVERLEFAGLEACVKAPPTPKRGNYAVQGLLRSLGLASPGCCLVSPLHHWHRDLEAQLQREDMWMPLDAASVIALQAWQSSATLSMPGSPHLRFRRARCVSAFAW